jgi:hypothetical protein
MNIRRYNVSFKETAKIFGDPLTITYEAPDHSKNNNEISPFACRYGNG